MKLISSLSYFGELALGLQKELRMLLFMQSDFVPSNVKHSKTSKTNFNQMTIHGSFFLCRHIQILFHGSDDTKDFSFF